MSAKARYIRAAPAMIRWLCTDRDVTFVGRPFPPGVALIDIDRFHVALAWLVSPLKRAEHAYLARLIAEPEWPDAEISARRAALDATPVDDALAAIEGWTAEPVTVGDAGRGGGVFPPERVRVLFAALAAIGEESLRARLDFAALDAALVPPDAWLEAGEALFTAGVLPALHALRDFYRAAAEAGEAVLVVHV